MKMNCSSTYHQPRLIVTNAGVSEKKEAVSTCIWRLTLSLPRKYHFAWYKEDGKAGAWKCWKIVIRTSSYRPVSYKFLTCSDVLIANSSFDGYKKCVFLRCLWSHSSLWLRKWMCKVFGRRLSFCHSVSSCSEGTFGRSCQILGVLWIELLSPSKADWGLASAIVRSCPWRCFSSACATCLKLSWDVFVASFMLHLVESCPSWSSFAVFGFKSGLRPCQVAICRAAL